MTAESIKPASKRGCTHKNISTVVARLKNSNRRQSERGISVFVDLKKAYDTVPRDRMIMYMLNAAETDADRQLISIIANLHLFQQLQVGIQSIETFRGVA